MRDDAAVPEALLNSDELRTTFLRYFEARGHRRIESAPLVPHDDPTLLFTSAGMVQFKPYFTGRATPPALRMTSIQRCFRTTDIEEVGDASHHTFFEMLGNFSVGDYFKTDVIPWAWDFVTRELGLPADRLWNTVFEDDDEAVELWVKCGQKRDRIYRYTEEQGNFWGPAGDFGPCGPCSEVFYDWGEEFGCGPDCEPAHDCGRFLEVWNLVFMSLFQDEQGQRTPLARPNIDTGAGLDRLSRVLQNAPSTYETDLFAPIMSAAAAAVGRAADDADTTRMMRTIADHARAITFLIADGVLPSNEGRGYVVRRLIRRAVYYGRLLGREEPFLGPISDAVVGRMKTYYPFLAEQSVNIRSTLAAEEEQFGRTLDAGMSRLEGLIARLEGSTDALPGEEVFRLYSTYGVPRELTAEIAARHGLRVDLEGFEAELARERELSRSGAGFHSEVLSEARVRLAGAGKGGRFVGYDAADLRTTIEGIFRGTELLERAVQGESVQLVLAETPFYPEGGGQVGDAGELRTETGLVRVDDTQRDEGLVLHSGTVAEGYVAVGQSAAAAIDRGRRGATMRNHTGTHLLHAALREVLGGHVRQMGSYVAPARLRFDYQQPRSPSADERLAVQRLVNAKIREDIPVQTRVMARDAALGEGVLAFFGDKYGDEVRVVEMVGESGRFSAELCGGTHCDHTGQIGLMILREDSGISAGVRRVEALTGAVAEQYVQDQLSLLDRVTGSLGVQQVGALEARVQTLLSELAAMKKDQEKAQQASSVQVAEALAGAAESAGASSIVVGKVDGADVDGLVAVSDGLRRRLPSLVSVLAAPSGDKLSFVVIVSDDLVDKIDARTVLNQDLAAAGARGGGSPRLARGGGSKPEALDQALVQVRARLKERLAG